MLVSLLLSQHNLEMWASSDNTSKGAIEESSIEMLITNCTHVNTCTILYNTITIQWLYNWKQLILIETGNASVKHLCHLPLFYLSFDGASNLTLQHVIDYSKMLLYFFKIYSWSRGGGASLSWNCSFWSMLFVEVGVNLSLDRPVSARASSARIAIWKCKM